MIRFRILCAALALLLSSSAFGQVLIKEIVSREVTIFSGAPVEPSFDQIVSREISLFSRDDTVPEFSSIVSREVGLIVGTTNVPPAITDVLVTASPDNSEVTLDWTAYLGLLHLDIERYDVYVSDSPITSVAGMVPVAVVSDERTSLTLSGLAAYEDHYFVLVPVDVLGGFDPDYRYTASYVLGAEVISREVTMFFGGQALPAFPEAVSREIMVVVVDPEPPPAVAGLRASGSADGTTVLLDWTSYDELIVGDVDTYLIYQAPNSFTNVTGLTPVASVAAGQWTYTLTGLPALSEYSFAVVPVDAGGNFDPIVQYATSYVISPQVVSREISFFIGGLEDTDQADLVSREISIVAPSTNIPAPVTGLDSGFYAETSSTEFGALRLDWSAYPEVLYGDVVRYRVYVSDAFFSDVSGMSPFAFVTNGELGTTLAGLTGRGIFHVAVVAEDALGQFDPAVRSFSAQASVSGVGEVADLVGTSGVDRIAFAWSPPPDAAAFLAGYRVYLGAESEAVSLPATAVDWVADGLDPASGYPFRITTLDFFGNESGGSFLLGSTLLPNPTNLVLAGVDDEVRLYWDAVEPSSLVKYYAVYSSDMAITNVSGLVPDSVWFGASARLGSFADIDGQHYAVVAVNTLDGFAASVSSVSATRQSQVVDFPALSLDVLPISLAASASSGLPIRFTASPSSVANIVDGALIALQGGTVLLRAIQDGDENYWPAEASQSLRLPPRIIRFALDDQALSDGGERLLGPNGLLSAEALDADGIRSAEFFLREVGVSEWTSLRLDNVVGDGFTAVLPMLELADGEYELRVQVRTWSDLFAERVHRLTLGLAPSLRFVDVGEAIEEGMLLEGQLSLPRPRDVDTLITLSSSRPTSFEAMPSLTLPAGDTSVTFRVRAAENVLLQAHQEVLLTASAAGAAPVSISFLLLDDDRPGLTLSLDRDQVAESAGEFALTATVLRDPVSSVALLLTPTASLADTVLLPATVEIPAGEAAVSFSVGVIDDVLFNGSRQVELRADALLPGGEAAAMSPPVTLFVGDDEGALLALDFDAGWIAEGASGELMLQRRGGPSNVALPVAVTADPADALALPATVTLPAGVFEIAIPFSSVDDGVTGNRRDVRVDATAVGYSPAMTGLLVTDQPQADLLISYLSAPTLVDTESLIPVSYQLANQGLGPSEEAVTQRILLYKEALDGAGLLLYQHTELSRLDAGGTVDHNITIRAPREAGLYWLVAVADAAQSEAEILESNNQAVFGTPIEVAPAYTASVVADVELAPINTPITLSGVARDRDGDPVSYVLVNLHLQRGDSVRIFSALTDVAGRYELVWTPLPGEGGDYEIGATHPGLESAEMQDAFSLLSVDAEFPEGRIQFNEGGTTLVNGVLRNPTAHAVSGLTLLPGFIPSGLSAVIDLPVTGLAPGEEVAVTVELSADPGFYGEESIALQLESSEGIRFDVPLELQIDALTPRLVVEPTSLACSVLRGTQKNVSFTLRNDGGAESGPITLLLPELYWLQAVSPTEIASLLPGQEITISLQLSPHVTEPLTQAKGNLVISAGSGQSRRIPFAFRVVSDLSGDFEVEVVDEFFFFSESPTRVSGATVVMRDAISSEEIQRATTGTNGVIRFADVPEGWYTVEVDSPSHTRWRGNYYVNAGDTNVRQIFISRELVTYTWSVEEVELQDRYRVSVESTFEVNVPAPVVTVYPGSLDVEDLNLLGQTKVVNFTFENHGLIAADHGAFDFESHPFYEVTPLIRDIGLIPAKSSVTIPVTVKRVGVFGADGTPQFLADGKTAAQLSKAAQAKMAGGIPCSFGGRFSFDFLCGLIPVKKGTSIPASGVEGACEGSSPGSFGGGFSGGFGPFVGLPSFSIPNLCDCNTYFGGEAKACVSGKARFKIPNVLSKLASKITAVLPSGFRLKSFELEVGAGGEACICCQEDGSLGWSGKGEFGGAIKGEIVWGPPTPLGLPAPPDGKWNIYKVGWNADVGLVLTLGGDIKITAEKDCEGESDVCVQGSVYVQGFAGVRGSASIEAVNNITKESYKGSVSAVAGGTAKLSLEAKWCQNDDSENGIRVCFDAGIDVNFTATLERISPGLGPSAGADFQVGLDLPRFNRCFPAKDKSLLLAEKGTVPAEDDVFEGVGFDPIDFSDAIVSDGEFFALPEVREIVESDSGVCAKVKIQVDQDVVMTRSAFRATLELSNQQDDISLEEVGFDFEIRDADGNDAQDVFNYRITRLDRLDAIDGTGLIAPLASGVAQWTLIPRDSAAPLSNTVYTIGGTISYRQNGQLLRIPVEPVPITVRPDAALYLKYFHQRDVFSDDPYTDQIEPSIPYGLAVMIENRGAGIARDLHISSAQPTIVENEKGLLIDFKIIAAQLAGEPLAPSLNIGFGDIAPGERKVGTWLFTSSLQGLFIDYEATFEHLDGFGDPRISLIKEVEIHEMIHAVKALGAADDGQPDFLANDVEDLQDLPDTIHLSDGGIEPVAVFEDATINGTLGPATLSVTISADLAGGWGYLRIPDPGRGNFRLVSAIRSDGLEIPVGDNIWSTDRTFTGLGRRPVYEHNLHLVDFDSTGSYTLFYEPAEAPDLQPPVSRVIALAPTSTVEIPVSWGGEDAGGIAAYDIQVQIDGGEWITWLEGTTRTSSLYPAEPGRVYSFRSIAYDAAGNAEVPDDEADTTTIASLGNAAPVFATYEVPTLMEGETLSLRLRANDPDGDAAELQYELVAASVSGVSVDPIAGTVQWVSSEAHGGTTQLLDVAVFDGGSPVGRTTTRVAVVVQEMNAEPKLSLPESAVAIAGQTFMRPVLVDDADLPAQTLRLSLAPGTPEGLRLEGQTLVWDVPMLDDQSVVTVGLLLADDGSPAKTTEALMRIVVQNDGDAGSVVDTNLLLRLVGAPPADEVLSCGIAAPAPDTNALRLALENPCGELFVTVEIERDLPGCHGLENLRYIYTASNSCGNVLSYEQQLIFVDLNPPVMASTNIQLGCAPGDVSAIPGLTASDGCAVESLTLQSDVLQSNESQRVRQRVYRASDVCGNVTIATQSLTWVELDDALQIEPILSSDLGCNPALVPAADPSVVQPAGLEVSVLSSDDTVSGCSFARLIVYSVRDACGRSGTVTQEIRWLETVTPRFVDAPASFTAPPCSTAAVPVVSAMTACGELVELAPPLIRSEPGFAPCTRLEQRVWSLDDVCGLRIAHTQIVTLSSDADIQVVGELPADQVLGCNDADASSAFAAFVAALDDPCGSLQASERIERDAPGCLGSQDVLYIYTASNACGAVLTHQQHIRFVDTEPPLMLSTNIDLGCAPASLDVAALMAADACGVEALELSSDTVRSNGAVRVRERVYRASDACGNTTLATQTIHWVDAAEQLSLPVLPLRDLGCNPASIPLGDPALVGLDPTVLSSEDLVTGCEHTRQIVYEVRDACGRNGVVTQELRWLQTQSPSFVDAPPSFKAEPCASPALPAVTAVDACGDQLLLPAPVITTRPGDAACVQIEERVWTIMGPCGSRLSHTQLVTLTSVPTISVISALPVPRTLTCSDPEPDSELAAFVAALDDPCGALFASERLVRDAPGCLGRQNIRIVYTASNVCGDVFSHEQIVRFEDEIAPIMLSTNIDLGCAPASLEGIPAMIATDNCGVDTLEQIGDRLLSNGAVRVWERIYRASDTCGNTTLATQAVHWVDAAEELLVPELPLRDLGCNPASIPLGDPALVGLDPTVLSSEDSVTGCEHERRLVYEVRDACGRSGVVTQELRWLESPSAIAIIGELPADLILGCGEPEPASELPRFIAALDETCGELMFTEIREERGLTCTGQPVFDRIYQAANPCGIVIGHRQRIRFEDQDPPVMLSTSIALGCDLAGLDDVPELTAVDACGSVSVSLLEENLHSLAFEMTRLRIYEAVDACGNSAIATQVVTWTGPGSDLVLDPLPDLELGCNPVSLPVDLPTALQNPDFVVRVEQSMTTSTACMREQQTVYRVEDGCSRIGLATQVIRWTSGVAPQLRSPLADELDWPCGQPVPLPDPIGVATMIDAPCGLQSVSVETQTQPGLCSGADDVSYIYAATSQCGETLLVTQRVIHVAGTVRVGLSYSVSRADSGTCPGADRLSAVAGTPLRLCVDVQNPGQSQLANVMLQIDLLGLSTNLGPLASGESRQLQFDRSMPVTSRSSLAKVMAEVPDQPGELAEAEAAIELDTQRFDLSLSQRLDTPGPFSVGDVIRFLVTLRNRGQVPARDVELIGEIPPGLSLQDPDWVAVGPRRAHYRFLLPVNVARGAGVMPDLLEPGESLEVPISFAITQAAAGQSLTQVVSIASAADPFGQSVLLRDASAADLVAPIDVVVEAVDTTLPPIGLTLESQINGLNDDAVLGLMFAMGAALEWTYDVTNTGSVALAAVQLTDGDPALLAQLQSGDDNANDLLDVGETWRFVGSAAALPGAFMKESLVTAQPVDATGQPLAGAALVEASDMSMYFGTSARIGDRVWYDDNHNGRQDAGEVGAPGVEVILLAADGSAIATQTTDAQGVYGFGPIAPGEWQLRFDWEMLSGAEVTLADVGDEAGDSDVNPATGRSRLISAAAGDADLDVDLGLWRPAHIAGAVWFDLDGSGDASGENLDSLGIESVAVSLYRLDDSGDILVDSMQTGADGAYRFERLLAGSYRVAIDPATVLAANEQARVDFTSLAVDVAVGQGVTAAGFAITLLPTAISLERFSAQRVDAGVEVEWTTSWEQDTLGFQVFRLDRNDVHSQVGDALILSVGASGGHTYRILDIGAQGGRYILVEVETDLSTQVQGLEAIAQAHAPALGDPTRLLRAKDDSLEVVTAADVRSYLFSGFTSPPQVLDLTDPDAPLEWLGDSLEVDGEWGTYLSPPADRRLRIQAR